MKKILFIIICFFSIHIVYAKSIPEFIPVMDKCHLKIDNQINIPVKIISSNDGTLTKLINKYKIGNIYNNDSIEVNNDNIQIDTLKDNNQNSHLYLSVKEDLNVYKGQEITSFIINMTLEDENNINILGNTIYITEDVELCNTINDMDLSDYYTSLKQNNKKETKFDKLNILLIIITLISIGSAIYVLRKKK